MPILIGDVFDVLPTLPEGHFDCAVTSPPYWNLRSYLDDGDPLKPRELGSEPTPDEYVAQMVRVCSLVRRVLTRHGTLWLNVADTYVGSGGGGGGSGSKTEARGDGVLVPSRRRYLGLPAGNLCLVPQRLALALQADGWLIRSQIIWRKPAPMPESVGGWQWQRCRVVQVPQSDNSIPECKVERTGVPVRGKKTGPNSPEPAQFSLCDGCDKCRAHGGYVLRRGSWRPTRSHEVVLQLAVSDDYYGDGVPVMTDAVEATTARNSYSRVIDDPDEQYAVRHDHDYLGEKANARDVQEWGPEPMTAALCQACGHFVAKHRKKTPCQKCGGKMRSHYAAYPSALPEWCIRASVSQRGYCPTCSAPWARVMDDDATTGWRPTCSCPEQPPRAGRVLDPFGGTGRTALAAIRQGCDCTLIELNPHSAQMARHIIDSESPLFSGVRMESVQ